MSVGSASGRLLIVSTLFFFLIPSLIYGQKPAENDGDIIPADLFEFATVEQGRAVLSQPDQFSNRLSPFDCCVRLGATEDPGVQAVLNFAASQVVSWTQQDRMVIENAISEIAPILKTLRLPLDAPIQLIKTTGKEEGGAAYTRGDAIIFPAAKLGNVKNPPARLLAHELFHVISRADEKLRDDLYALIGFKRVQNIELPADLDAIRITNPDAPRMEHVMKVVITKNQETFITPFLYSDRGFDRDEPNLFAYLNFRLLEVAENSSGQWEPVLQDGEVIYHEPSLSDFRRQISNNTQYIIHPEEIIADNFAIWLTHASAKDVALIESIERVMNGARN